MNKPNRAFPKGIVAYVRYDKTFTFTHFMAHPKTGYWVLGSEGEFSSGELLEGLLEIINGGDRDFFNYENNWSEKLKYLLKKNTRFIAR